MFAALHFFAQVTVKTWFTASTGLCVMPD